MSWSRLDRGLHWGMAVLFMWQFTSRWIAAALPDGHEAIFHLNGLHSLAGYAIFLLGISRLVHRVRHGRPPMPDAPWVERAAAHMVHAVFYLMMAVMPVSGFLSAGNPTDQTVVLARQVHHLCSDVLLALIALHVSAAIWHEFARGDGTLRRMLGITSGRGL